jgi:hypothetical protein
MMKAGREAIASDKLDNVTMAVNWPDSIAEIKTGKQLRNEIAKRRRPKSEGSA